MKVKASREGYYKNQIRSIGEEFEIESKEELGTWMDVLEAPVVEEEVPVLDSNAPKAPKAPKADALSNLI